MNNFHWEDVTSTSGIKTGISYGAAWGDFNRDGYPDLWVNYHYAPGILYLNQTDGTFVDVTEIFVEQPTGDHHGTAWADFDNDGDRDLVQLVGGGRGTGIGPQFSNQLYVNEGGKLEDRASSLGVDYPLARGRSPLWFDFDGDGLLDLVVGADPRKDGLEAPPKLFKQNPDGTFEDVSASAGFEPANANAKFFFLSDLSGDGNLDFVAKTTTTPFTVYDTTSVPLVDITSETLPDSIQAGEIASADFNGDLLPDLYITTTGDSRNDFYQTGTDSAVVELLAYKSEKGVSIDTSGEVTFDLFANQGQFSIGLNEVYIGASGIHPTDWQFTLSAENPEVEGIFPHNSGVERGIYIGYEPNLQRWQLFLSSSDRTILEQNILASSILTALIESSEPISELTPIGFDEDDRLADDQLLINTAQGLIDQSEEAGISSIPTQGNGLVTGDFDNDMDQDVYIVTSRSIVNTPNILYENSGDGTFTAVPDAGGAAGTEIGKGDFVVSADYDLDGFLDFLVGNGGGTKSPLTEDTPYQLFRNQGNENHWLQIDLEGILSNRDGIGAKVFATAGGITQLREQSGGINHKAQNHQRIHFGLAEHTTVDELVIEWPSGIVQKLNDIPTDQLIRIIEPSGSFIPGQPVYQPGTEAGVFIWQDYFDGPYHLRTVGAADPTEFAVNLIANDPLLEVTPVQLENNDVLDVTEFGFSLTSKLVGWQDGIDFYLKPGTEALLSVTQDEVANPRQVNVGQQRARLSPTGWIVSSDELPERPAFSPGNDLGLFFGQGANDDTLEFRWSGDGNWHETSLSVLAADDISSFSPINLEPNDELATFSNGIEIQGQVSTWYDGLDVTTAEPTKIGVAYEQDGLFQPDLVNPLDDLLGLPNAYQLPLATPYGRLEYDPSVDEGIFLWLDEEDFWHLRMTGSEEGSRYVGSIVSDQAAIDVQMVKLEETDMVNTTDPSRIDFDFRVWQSGEDGIDFRFPEGAALTLNLEEPGEDAADLLHIGAEQWSVSELPLDLSGW